MQCILTHAAYNVWVKYCEKVINCHWNMARSTKFLENFTKKPSNSNAKSIDQNLRLCYLLIDRMEWVLSDPEMSLAYRLVAYKKECNGALNHEWSSKSNSLLVKLSCRSYEEVNFNYILVIFDWSFMTKFWKCWMSIVKFQALHIYSFMLCSIE